MRRLAVIGPPGADGETVAELIAARLDVPVVRVGDAFQAEFRAGTPLSEEARRYMDAGELVPDRLLMSMMLPLLDRDGFVLENFPRDEVRAAALDAGLRAPLDRVVELVLPDAEVVRRLCDRRICRGCGRLWHLTSAPPAEPGRCDRCGGELFRRDDDHRDVVATRVGNYRSAVAPALERYRALGILRPVDATLSLAEIVEVALC